MDLFTTLASWLDHLALEDRLSVPDPTDSYPLPDYPRYCVFLRPIAAAVRRRSGTQQCA